MHKAIIGIGSNINADHNIREAMELLAEVSVVKKLSQLVITAPIGIRDQADFTNGAVAIETDLDETNLRQVLKTVEDQLGRDRTRPKYGPREIDLDIVVFDDCVLDDDYYERDFLRKAVDEVWGK